eukprot:GHVT01060970.1.p1 GENE.GHVT01060970.1~~GHVT01060970.1.p1  ORF type:complete len:323 (+),score=54.96 GHVT01060970.1:779-1747(+)
MSTANCPASCTWLELFILVSFALFWLVPGCAPTVCAPRGSALPPTSAADAADGELSGSKPNGGNFMDEFSLASVFPSYKNGLEVDLPQGAAGWQQLDATTAAGLERLQLEDYRTISPHAYQWLYSSPEDWEAHTKTMALEKLERDTANQRIKVQLDRKNKQLVEANSNYKQQGTELKKLFYTSTAVLATALLGLSCGVAAMLHYQVKTGRREALIKNEKQLQKIRRGRPTHSRGRTAGRIVASVKNVMKKAKRETPLGVAMNRRIELAAIRKQNPSPLEMLKNEVRQQHRTKKQPKQQVLRRPTQEATFISAKQPTKRNIVP